MNDVTFIALVENPKKVPRHGSTANNLSFGPKAMSMIMLTQFTATSCSFFIAV